MKRECGTWDELQGICVTGVRMCDVRVWLEVGLGVQQGPFGEDLYVTIWGFYLKEFPTWGRHIWI